MTDLTDLTQQLVEALDGNCDTSRIVLKIADALPAAYCELDEIPAFDLESVA